MIQIMQRQHYYSISVDRITRRSTVSSEQLIAVIEPEQVIADRKNSTLKIEIERIENASEDENAWVCQYVYAIQLYVRSRNEEIG